ncbi:MAG: undecaprenyl-phosphate glucose phosphotransferase [Rikenellaceae bacterium]
MSRVKTYLSGIYTEYKKNIIRYFIEMRRVRVRNGGNVIYIGSDSNIIELYDVMTVHGATGYNIAGYFDHEPNLKFNAKCKYLGNGDQIVEYLQSNKVDRVYCGLPLIYSHIVEPIINHCEKNLIRFFSVPNLRDYSERRMHLEFCNHVPLLAVREEPLRKPANSTLKRLFDLLFSLCFLATLFLPIYIVVGIITKCTSPGPIFFKQRRHGLGGKEFYMYKFRSMKVNNDADTVQATLDDPRKTKFGDFLRKTSIDELPQFLNVFLGDMSIVGPRPHMIKHTEEYSQLIDNYMVRHFVKPGVTGWAQVSGYRGETKNLSEMQGRVKADIWYIEHWRFRLDLYIIMKTVTNIVYRRDSKAF